MAFQEYATLPQFWRGATSGLHRTCLNHQIWWLTHIKSPFSLLNSPSFLIKLPSPWISPPSSGSTHRIGRCNARSASYRSSRSSRLRRGWESESRVRCVFDVGENPKFQPTIPQVISILMPWSSTFIPKWLPTLVGRCFRYSGYSLSETSSD